MTTQPVRDRVGGCLEQHPVERGAFLEREDTLERRDVEQRVEAHQRQLGEADRLAFVHAEQHVDVSALPAHHRIHDGIHVAALAVQQQQPHHVAPELQLVEVALLAEPHPAQQPQAREHAGARRGDRRSQRVVVDGVIALEGKAAHHPLLLRREGSRRARGDEQERKEGTQLTRSGRSPMLATSRRTVNLFDT